MMGDPEWESEWWGCRVCPGGREIVLRYEYIPMRPSFPVNRSLWLIDDKELSDV
jgi:hypothetical protein